MKQLINLTTSECDLGRYAGSAELLTMLAGFDGVELMRLGRDTRGIVPKARVLGVHLNCFPYWLDCWNGDTAACLREFGSMEAFAACYGGTDRAAILRHYRAELAFAAEYGAEYVVFHVSDASIEESFTRRYRHTSEAVIDASCELLNALFPMEGYAPLLLLENLWLPGLTFTDPALTKRMLDGVDYANKGLMLDTGHLLHTKLSLRTQSEGLAYIGRMLDAHDSLCASIYGVHLHQSCTGAYARSMMRRPPAPDTDYAARSAQMFAHAFRVDPHRPFTCAGVGALVARIAPEYLTFEFISRSREEHRRMLTAQKNALAK